MGRFSFQCTADLILNIRLNGRYFALSAAWSALIVRRMAGRQASRQILYIAPQYKARLLLDPSGFT